MITVRHYTQNDWKKVESWWREHNEIAPCEGMMPLDSSFIAEIDGEPALAIAVYLTNTQELAYLENFVGNPELSGPSRREAAHILVQHACKFAHSRGYKRLMCMTEKEPLKARYQELGFYPTLNGLTTFIRRMN